MNKLFAALLVSTFAMSTAFAASHAGAPMAGASGAKMEKKDDMKKDAAMASDKPVKKTKAKKAKKAAAEKKA